MTLVWCRFHLVQRRNLVGFCNAGCLRGDGRNYSFPEAALVYPDLKECDSLKFSPWQFNFKDMIINHNTKNIKILMLQSNMGKKICHHQVTTVLVAMYMPRPEIHISSSKIKELFDISPLFFLCYCYVQCRSFHGRRLLRHICFIPMPVQPCVLLTTKDRPG